MEETGLAYGIALQEFDVLLASTKCIPSSNFGWQFYFLFFHMDKNVIGFPSLCLGVSLIYASTMHLMLLLSAYPFCECMFCIVAF